MAGANKPVEHLVVSDGLASVSIFIEDAQKANGNLQGGTRRGAVNAYGRQLGEYHVTAVGEVPHATVKMISQSVVFNPRKP